MGELFCTYKEVKCFILKLFLKCVRYKSTFLNGKIVYIMYVSYVLKRDIPDMSFSYIISSIIK